MLDSIIMNIDALTMGFVSTLYQALASELGTTFKLVSALSIILYGIGVINGWVSASASTALQLFGTIIVVYVFGTQWATFSSVFYDLLTKAPSQIAGVALSAYDGSVAGSSANSFLTESLDVILKTSSHLIHGTSWNAFGAKILGLILFVIGGGMVTYAGFLIILSKIAVAVLLGLAPVFICLYLIKSTRGICEGWLRQLLNFALVPLIVYTILVFVIGISNMYMLEMSDALAGKSVTNADVFPVLLSSAISILLLRQVMGISSAIAGGVALSAGNLRHGINDAKSFGGGIRSSGAYAGAKGRQALTKIRSLGANKITNA